MMEIDLTEKEVQILFDSLDLWCRDPAASARFARIAFSAIQGMDIEERRQGEKVIAEAEKEASRRNHQVILLKARILQASIRQSEHTVE